MLRDNATTDTAEDRDNHGGQTVRITLRGRQAQGRRSLSFQSLVTAYRLRADKNFERTLSSFSTEQKEGVLTWQRMLQSRKSTPRYKEATCLHGKNTICLHQSIVLTNGSLSVQSAQEKLALACIGVSSSTQKDVELMSKVVFVLFSNELVKVSLTLDHTNI